jgi:hypothetical protein
MSEFHCRCFEGGEPVTVGFRWIGGGYPDPSAMFQHQDHEGYCAAGAQHEGRAHIPRHIPVEDSVFALPFITMLLG